MKIFTNFLLFRKVHKNILENTHVISVQFIAIFPWLTSPSAFSSPNFLEISTRVAVPLDASAAPKAHASLWFPNNTRRSVHKGKMAKKVKWWIASSISIYWLFYCTLSIFFWNVRFSVDGKTFWKRSFPKTMTIMILWRWCQCDSPIRVFLKHISRMTSYCSKALINC